MDMFEYLCDQYLQGLKATLWGQPFEIISSAGRKEAAVWLAKQIEGVIYFGRESERDTSPLHCEVCASKEQLERMALERAQERS